jgi:carbamate kinase
MDPKVQAACGCAQSIGHEAVIVSLTEIAKIVAGGAGTRVRT